MIHDLVVSIEESPQQLRKRARKLAMTGGYEVSLPGNYEETQLITLFELHQKELNRYEQDSAAFHASISVRILRAIQSHPSCSTSLADQVDSCLLLPS